MFGVSLVIVVSSLPATSCARRVFEFLIQITVTITPAHYGSPAV
jgi:hypothetical protein